jgi:pSer/pThr/pTyr-binding forkhead associated (FHA) protein
MAYLVVTMAGKELYRRELAGPVTLGRSTECDLWLNDNGVSRRHCRFDRGEGGTWEVHDLGSRNGVFVHGERISKHPLKDGDHVRIGGVKIAFHEVGYVSSRPAIPQRGSGDSMSDTVVSSSASRIGRVLPTPRADTPGKAAPPTPMAPAPEAPAAPLAFQRPPARPIPVAEKSDENGNGEHHQSLIRRFLHK